MVTCDFDHPSIGAIGQIIPDPDNQRLKGFLLPPVNSLQEMAELYQTGIFEVLAAYSEQTRISARVLTGGGIDPEDLTGFRYYFGEQVISTEAFIPLDGFGGLVYLGGNAPSRLLPADIKTKLAGVQQIAREKAQTPVRPLKPGYVAQLSLPNTLEGISESDIADLVRIYNLSFNRYLVPFNDETVRQMALRSAVGMVRNPAGTIVSVTMGEITTPLVENIRLCELTDSATDPTDEGARGSNYWAKRGVIKWAVHEDFPVIYSESRAIWAPVQAANLRLGMEYCGTLPRSCCIGSSREDFSDPTSGVYGDLFVMALTPDARQRYLTEII